MEETVDWPILTAEHWVELKELCPFLELFKELTLYFSRTTECRMSDLCLYFEDLLVEIRLQYLDKKDEMSNRLWYAANAAYTKLTKYYTRISSANFAIATVLDPRYKLVVYEHTQDPVALKESAELAIKTAFEKYSLQVVPLPVEAHNSTSVAISPPAKKPKFLKNLKKVRQNELDTYLSESLSDDIDDPLLYWRLNKTRFPILAKMARDYLALQPTSKDVEGTFSKGRRTIPYYRRSQNAVTIRNQMLVNSGYNLRVFI
jgi:hypothetical protein